MSVNYGEEIVVFCEPQTASWYKGVHVLLRTSMFFVAPVIVITVCHSIMAYQMVSQFCQLSKLSQLTNQNHSLPTVGQ